MTTTTSYQMMDLEKGNLNLRAKEKSKMTNQFEQKGLICQIIWSHRGLVQTVFLSPKDIPDSLEVSKEVQERIEKADNDNRYRRNNRKRDNDRNNSRNPPLPKNAPPVIRYGVPPPNMAHAPMGMPVVPPMPFHPVPVKIRIIHKNLTVYF